MTSDSMQVNPLETLAAEFIECHRRGESPSIEAFAARHPDVADEIRALFPTILAMENLKREKAPSPAAFVPKPGRLLERLGDFRIVREIGRGGMGIVYEAEQESLGRRVAVKVLPSQALLDEKKLQRFAREARTAGRLHHTNIVPVFGVGTQDGLHYYVMQLIRGVGLDSVIETLSRSRAAGKTLDDNAAVVAPPSGQAATASFTAQQAARALCSGVFAPALKDSGPRDSGALTPPAAPVATDIVGHATILASAALTPDVAPADQIPQANGAPVRGQGAIRLPRMYCKSVAGLGLQVAQALDYAHAQNVLHRDVKPANLLLDATGNLWVADFGLAKALEHDELSNPGDVVGTPQYMAPEQFHGKYDARSDICSLGLTLYELLTLRPAYQDTNRFALFRKITQEEPARPRQLNPAIPHDLETIILKAVARDPGRRYQTAQEMAADLQRFLADRPVRARRIGPIRRLGLWCRRNPAVAALTSVALLLLLTVLVVGAIGYVHTRDALDRETREHQKAVVALIGEAEQRQIAVGAQDKEAKQRKKAEATSTLALEVLDQIFEQLAPERITAATELTFASESGEEVEVTLQPTLSPETAALLKHLLTFYDKLANQGVDDPKLRHKEARANRRVGDIQFRLGQVEQALEAYQKSISRYQELAKHAPDDVGLTAELASVHNALSQAQLRSFQVDQARESLQAAVQLLTAPPTDPLPPKIAYELARTYYNLSKVPYGKFGPPGPKGFGGPPGSGGPPPGGKPPGSNPPGGGQTPPWLKGQLEAEKYLEKATQLLNPLVSEYPGIPAYRFLLALCYREKAQRPTWPPSKTDGKDRKEAIKLLGQLAKDFPNVPDYRFHLAETLAMLSPSPFFLPPAKDAEKDFQQALALAKELVLDHPNVPDYQISKSQIHMRLGELHLRGKEPSKAEEDYRQALKLENALVQRFPKVIFYQLTRARMQQSLASALLDQKDQKKWQEARKVLETSIEQLKSAPVREEEQAFVNFTLADSYDKLARALDKLEPALAASAREQANKLRPPFFGPFGPPKGPGKGGTDKDKK